MPPVQLAALGEQPVRAAVRQPVEMFDRVRRDDGAIGNPLVAVFIVRTPAAADIEQLAGQPGVQQFVCIFILEFDQTALSTPVAERFPLILRHLAKRLRAPEGFVAFAQGSVP